MTSLKMILTGKIKLTSHKTALPIRSCRECFICFRSAEDELNHKCYPKMQSIPAPYPWLMEDPGAVINKLIGRIDALEKEVELLKAKTHSR